MATHRVPPKCRHRERPALGRQPLTGRLQDHAAPADACSAPSHLAGSFDEHGYGSGHGTFGFTQYVTP